MKVWVPTTLLSALTAVWAATVVNAGSCARDTSRNCLNVPATINFSSVPEISNQIVGEEKLQPTSQKLNTDPPAPSPYTGPMIGTSPVPGRTPTVGYYWSLE